MSGEGAADPEGWARRVDRLERRVERERAAREQAERIAEHGMRDLWLTNRGLEERVAERTVELQHSLASATMAAEAKERFLADLGHDLTSPLHAVLGLLELVDATALSTQDQQRMSAVHEHASTLAGLLQALVELAGAEGAPGPDEISVQSPAAWTDTLVAAWARRAAAAGQLIVPSVHGADQANVAAHWERLARVVDAMLDNAVRHASSGSVSVVTTITDDDVRVAVIDDGPGMTADEAETAAEPFVTHGSPGRGTPGPGIGLAVAARRAAAAGGGISVESEGSGTRASVWLPRRRG